MTYEQFIESRILWHERVLADIRAGKVFWCEGCKCWVPIDEKRQDPWAGDWPVCAECLANSSLEDNLVTEEEYHERLADSAMEAEARKTDQAAEE
jgi:hypothetical protein